MADMTPNEAQDARAHLDLFEGAELFGLADRALATLAAMRVEHDHGVVDWEEVDGRYEVYHHTRLVGEWRAT